jgi:membrane protease YdiL (CAAX protease family)
LRYKEKTMNTPEQNLARTAEKRLRPAQAALVFASFTAYFYLLLFTLRPFLQANFSLNPALYWFITGYFLFIPLFACAWILARAEGNTGMRAVLSALHVRPFVKNDWKYALNGLLLAFVLSGAIFALWLLLHEMFGVRPLATTPWFMEMRPFSGSEKWLLLAWLPMFFFNIAGEEMLWRGAVQARLQTRYAWPLCSALWLLFHLPFGLDLLIMLVPVIVIIPYAFHKTRNTLVGIFIHGMFNGPMFIAVALGVLQ